MESTPGAVVTEERDSREGAKSPREGEMVNPLAEAIPCNLPLTCSDLPRVGVASF